MRNAGRPRSAPSKLMDGFYIEVSDKGSTTKGIKIRSESAKAMENAAEHYAKHKSVMVLGEYKDEKWLVFPSKNLRVKSE